MGMYLNDKRYRVTLRLNEDQFSYLADSAGNLGVSPSEFLRMVINSSLVTARKMAEGKDATTALQETYFGTGSVKGLVTGRENDDTNKHDSV